MQGNTLSVEELLASCQGASQRVAEESGNDYFPPEGPGTAMITGQPIFRTYTKNAEVFGIINIPMQILDGAGKDNDWTLVLSAANPVHQKTLSNLYSVVTGDPSVPSLYADRIRGILKNAEGKTVQFVSSRGKAKPGQDPFKNVKFTGLV